MKMNKLFILTLLFSLTLSAADTYWTKIEDKNGLKLFSGPKSDTGIYPFKAIFTVKHELEDVVMVLADTSKKTQWVPRMSKSETLEQKSADNRVEYGVVNMPWPLKDRDAIVRILTTVDKTRTHVRLNIQSDMDEQIINKSNIRAKVYPSLVDIYYLPETKETLMEIETFVDPKGAIPKWIVNFFQKIEAKRMARQMKRQLDKNLYSKEQLAEVARVLKELSLKN
ncbi:MAG: hypothetical protein EP326_07250 [Deltaproteobacteria bacterium]|nr:MAG: hypothetical protein EP326_07250 [Deltaproteobacteria bacterium]